MSTFSPEQKEAFLADLGEEIEVSRTNASVNQGWDIAFKVGILLLNLVVTVCATTIAAVKKEPPLALALANAIGAAVITVISAFAFNQFNFALRHQIWQRSADAFSALRVRLLTGDPDSDPFQKRFDQVTQWGDHTSLQELQKSE